MPWTASSSLGIKLIKVRPIINQREHIKLPPIKGQKQEHHVVMLIVDLKVLSINHDELLPHWQIETVDDQDISASSSAQVGQGGKRDGFVQRILRNHSPRIRGREVKCGAWGLLRQLPGLLRGALRSSHLWRLRRWWWWPSASASAQAWADGSLQRWVPSSGGDHLFNYTYLFGMESDIGHRTQRMFRDVGTLCHIQRGIDGLIQIDRSLKQQAM